MAPTQPILAGTTLPHPSNIDAGSGWEEEYSYRGASLETQTGVQLTKLATAGVKRVHILEWLNLTASEKDDIITAYTAIKFASGSFTAPDGDTFTVTRDGDDTLVFSHTKVSGQVVNSVTMRLREV